MIREADNSKHLLSALHENAARRANDVDLKLKQVSSDIGQFIASHVKGNMEAMLNCAEQQCPRVLSHKDGKLAADVRHACQSKCQISPEFLSTLITDQIGQEVHNKVNEINLIIANHISDAVIGECESMDILQHQRLFIVSKMCSDSLILSLNFCFRRGNRISECCKYFHPKIYFQ